MQMQLITTEEANTSNFYKSSDKEEPIPIGTSRKYNSSTKRQTNTLCKRNELRNIETPFYLVKVQVWTTGQKNWRPVLKTNFSNSIKVRNKNELRRSLKSRSHNTTILRECFIANNQNVLDFEGIHVN